MIYSKKKYSMRVYYTVVGLRSYLKQNKIKIKDIFIQKIKLAKPNEITFSDLNKIIQLSKGKTQIKDYFENQEIFQQLSQGGQVITTQKLISVFQQIDQLIESNDKQQKNPKQKNANITKQNIKGWMQKLQRHMLNPEAITLCERFDIDNSSSLDYTSFNQLLLATKIKDFQNDNIRNILLDYIFFDKQNQKKGKINYVKFFNLNLRQKKDIKNEPYKNYSQQKIIPIAQPKLGQHLQQNKNKNRRKSIYDKIRQVSQLDQLMNKLSIQQSQSLNQLKDNHKDKDNVVDKQKVKIKIEQQKSTHTLEYYKKKFPRAINYYNLGIPQQSHIKFLQQLQDLLRNNKTYKDNDNPKSQKYGEYKHASQIFQMQQYQIFQVAKSVIQRQKNRQGIALSIEPKDIIQGQSEDCYFLSAIASLSYLHPQLIQHLFLFNSNKANYYSVKIFFHGQWQVVITDDRFLCFDNQPIYARPHGKQIWVMLLEKCWAKLFKNYFNINNGKTTDTFQALTGALTQYYHIKSKDSNQKILKQKIIEALKVQNQYVITANIMIDKNNEKLLDDDLKQAKKLGLAINNHSYSFLDVVNVEKYQLVRIRNPWGNQRTQWKGDWSFQSKKWTKQMRNKLNYNKNPQDGSFYMEINDFFKYFSQIVICKIRPNFVNSSIKTLYTNRKTTYFNMIIKQSGKYTVSIYQMNEKRIKLIPGQASYKYSPARIIIMKKIQNKKLKYISSKLTNEQYACPAQSYLQEGEYIVSVKVFWKEKSIKSKFREINLTSYGPEKVYFQPITEQVTQTFEKKLIESFAKQVRGKIRTYDCVDIPQAYNEISMDINLGIGYYMFVNQSEKPLQLKIKIQMPKVIISCSQCNQQIQSQIVCQKCQRGSQNSNESEDQQCQDQDQSQTKSQSRSQRSKQKQKLKQSVYIKCNKKQAEIHPIIPIIQQQLPLERDLSEQKRHVIGFFIHSTGFKYKYSQEIRYQNKKIKTSIMEQTSLVD